VVVVVVVVGWVQKVKGSYIAQLYERPGGP